jgi:hypothetical protein
MWLIELFDRIATIAGPFAVPAMATLSAILATVFALLRSRDYDAKRQRTEHLEALHAQIQSQERMRAEMERRHAEQLDAMRAQVWSMERVRTQIDDQRLELSHAKRSEDHWTERLRIEFVRQTQELESLRAVIEQQRAELLAMRTLAPKLPQSHGHNSVSRHHEPVDCSIFAPPEVPENTQFTIQAVFHLQRDVMAAARLAIAVDASANRLTSQPLEAEVPHGGVIDAFLECSALKISTPLQSLSWEESPCKMEFTCQLLRDNLDINAVLHLSVDGVPVGEVVFEIEVVAAASVLPLIAGQTAAGVEQLQSHFQRYRNAFVSYSRKDFRDVSYFTQGLSENGQNVMIDVSDIEPGDEWEKKLDEFVRAADVVYVMWSDNAAESKWVLSETKLAASLNSKRERPAVKPIPLQQPWPRPPKHLRKYGFYSTWHAHRTAQALRLTENSVG